MPDLKDKISKIASEVSNGYLLCQDDMNDAIINASVEQALNEEVIKRICEQANQNVYLALFHNKDTDRSNIQFDLADFASIIDKVRQSENDMESYNIAPDDFRSSLEIAAGTPVEGDTGLDDENEKLSQLNEIAFEKEKYDRLLADLHTMKTAEINSAISSFSDMFHDSKMMVHNGESIADMAKIAMRFVKDEELDAMKIAKAYDMISCELEKNGYTVNKELTKTSSLAINKDSDLLRPVRRYIESISKVAAINDMICVTKERITEYGNGINKIAEFLEKVA